MDKAYFEDKVCVVTGASTGIGYGLAEKLLSLGATVYLVARSKDKLKEDKEKLAAQYGDRVQIKAADVSDNEAVRQMIDDVFGKEGRIDFLFNNAGIGQAGPTERASIRAWERVINTNLWGVIHATHAVLPIMLAQRCGHIVNTASIGGLVPLPYQTIYCTAKYAVVGMSESLRGEMAPRGIAVSVVCPGAVATEIFSKGGAKTPAHALTADAAADIILEGVCRKKGIIVVGEDANGMYARSTQDPEGFEAFQQREFKKGYDLFVGGRK